jgi:hypothetical protein
MTMEALGWMERIDFTVFKIRMISMDGLDLMVQESDAIYSIFATVFGGRNTFIHYNTSHILLLSNNFTILEFPVTSPS